MVLSGLGFNCLGTGANYYHLSPPTMAASVYASVRGANMRLSSMGRQLLARTTTQTHKVICLPALEVTRTTGSLAEHGGEIEAVGSRQCVFVQVETYDFVTRVWNCDKLNETRDIVQLLVQLNTK